MWSIGSERRQHGYRSARSVSGMSHSGTQSHTGETRRVGVQNVTFRDTCISIQDIAVWDCPVWKIVVWKCHVWDLGGQSLYNIVIILFFQSLGCKVLTDCFWSRFCAFYISGVKRHKTVYRFYSYSVARILYALLYAIYMYYHYIRFICEFGRFNFLVGLRNVTRFNGRVNTSKPHLELC